MRARPETGELVVRTYLLLAAVAGSSLLFLGSPLLLPVGQALLAYPVLFRDLRSNRSGDAVRHMLIWALALTLSVILLTLLAPARVEPVILRGSAYRDEMFAWIRTGVGAESTPRLFLPQHLRHYLLTLALALFTAGLAGLFLGAVLLNYMNFYVGSLILSAARPHLAALFGWPIWSVARVIGFVLGAVGAAQIGLLGVANRRISLPPDIRRLLWWSLAFVLADLVLKAVLAPGWRRILALALR
jgi:hypothetical protein